MTKTWRRRALASGSVALLVVGLGVAGLPTSAVAKPAAAKPTFLSFVPAVQTLTSNTHKHLRVGVTASTPTEQGVKLTSMQVTVTRKGVAAETHLWTFHLKNGSLTFSPSTGKGAMKTGSQVAPFGKFALTLAATGKKHTYACGTYKTITQPVKVRGVLSFNTRSTGKNRWGKVTTSTKYRFSGRSQMIYELGTFQSCGGGTFTFPCSAETTFDISKAAHVVDLVSFAGNIDKVGGKTVSTLFTERNTALKKPKNAIREDSTDVRDKKMVMTVSGSNKVTLAIKGVGPVTGAAMLVSPKPGDVFTPQSCGKSGKTETTTSWEVAYTNGKSPLTVHEQIEGNYKLPNIKVSGANDTSVDRTTVS